MLRPGIRVACAVLWVCAAFSAQTNKRLWVLNRTGELIEYDILDFRPKQTIRVPRDVLESPENLQINPQGRMVFNPGIAVNPPTLSRNKIWLWNGRSEVLLDRGMVHQTAAVPDARPLTDMEPQCVLSEDGLKLLWSANERHETQRPDGQGEISTKTKFRLWETDLTGGQRTEIGSFEFPECVCGTGVCSETCPEAYVWTPESGVQGFFLVSHWIPGQIGATYQASYFYTRGKDKWSSTRIPVALEQILDASPGAGIVHAILDGGCCGWENEGDDQTLLTKNGKSVVLFDERKRYANPDYDVSFYTTDARLSPGASSVALTIAATLKPGSEIRLSDGGKQNPAELARIRKEIAEAPVVEVLRLQTSPKTSAVISHAALVGWISDLEILVVQEHTLVIFNVAKAARRKTPLTIPEGARVWLR